MPGVLIFGGTTEGRQAALREKDAVVCVTGEYARQLLPPEVNCRVGRLDREGMLDLMRRMRPDRVVDATHPFAAEVTANVAACCAELGIPLERVRRPELDGPWRAWTHRAKDAEEAARMAAAAAGNILLTTGSRTLDVYGRAVDPQRLWARVLPTADSLERCARAGIPASHVIAMQGPFSAAFNAALYDQLDIRVMVTKDSGREGGLEEKVLPALARELDVIIIDRPEAETCAGKV